MRKFTQIIISIIAAVLLALHLWKPNISIDGITLGLLVIAILPWLSSLFKSVEIPGLGKFEYIIDDIRDTAKAIAVNNDYQNEPKSTELSFLSNPNENPNLVLAWLRIEIEKRLRKFSEENENSVKTYSLRELINQLVDNKLLSSDVAAKIKDLLYTLNNAAHGVEIETSQAKWAIAEGSKLLAALDQRLKINRRDKVASLTNAR